jgi:arylsulfatase
MAPARAELEDHVQSARTTHGLDVWKLDFTNLRGPDLMQSSAPNPFERGPESLEYAKWMMDTRFPCWLPAQAIVGKWLQSLQGVPAIVR